MKNSFLLAMLFIGLTFSSNSFAALKILDFTGASNNYVKDSKSAQNIIAGISGRSFCQGQTTTVNSCEKSYSRASCNFKTVCPTTQLSITLTSDLSGTLMIADPSDKPFYKMGAYTAGQVATVNIPWSEICRNLTGFSDCSVAARSALKIGVYNSETKKSTYSAFITQISAMADNQYNIKLDKSESLSNIYGGIKDYKIVAGNEKAHLTDFSIVNNNMTIGEAGRLVGIRAFYAPAACNKSTLVNNSSDSQLINLDYYTYAILNNAILGLKNNVKYLMMLSLQDEAGNIGYYKDLEESCSEGKHTVTPQS